MMSKLPLDLIEEILIRVDATSLKRIRMTCKLWNALFTDQGFAEKHFLKAARESLVLVLKEYRVSPMRVNLNVPPSIEFKGPLSIKSNLQQVDILQVFHCDGLLLCTTKDDRLVVWNPCLGETWWVQHKPRHLGYTRFALGYVNHISCRRYKILRFWDCCNGDFGSEIYDFSSDSWRVVDEDVVHDLNCYLVPNGLSLKGHAYWYASGEGDNYHMLLRFDFATERFKRMCLPRFRNIGLGNIYLSVVREEKLSVLHQSFHTLKMDFWVTNTIDTDSALTWTKSFTVDIPSHFEFYFESFLIDDDKKVALCCNRSLKPSLRVVYITGEDVNVYNSEIPYLEYTNESWWQDTNLEQCFKPFIFNYVPSLAQLQQGRGNRKESI